MAVYRPTPKCPFCGKPIARAVHREVSIGFIGDTFVRWEFFDCNCKEYKKTTKAMNNQ